MKSPRVIALVLVLSVGAAAPTMGAFSSKGVFAISASVTTGASAAQALTIEATPLPSQALFGKNLAIPVTIVSSSGPINTKNLRVEIVYQLLGPTGAALNSPTPVPVQFIPGTPVGNTLPGTAVVQRSDLVPIQSGGSVTYVFQALQSGSGVMLNSAGSSQAPANIGGLPVLPSPFATAIRDPWCEPVGPAGGHVHPPDLTFNDGRTGVDLAPQTVELGNLCIHVESPDGFPQGPGQTAAAAIYTITLENTSLAGTAGLTLSYPSDLSGKVLDSKADPNTLGMYWLDTSHAASQWRALSEATLDTTLHTLVGTTGHFSTFALFPAGAIGAADLRPSERIITPNGDGINDTATFSGLAAGDEVKIYDIRGRRVRSIPGPSAVWDGKDDGGKVVESGVYIYQYTVAGQRASGVILVAK